MKIAHVMRISNFTDRPDLQLAQSLTLKSWEWARKFAADNSDVEVVQCVTSTQSDAVDVSDDIHELAELQRSIQDVGTWKLDTEYPIFSDVLGLCHEEITDADYMIYTDVDLHLVPHFYPAIAQLTQERAAFSVPRRIVPDIGWLDDKLATLLSLSGDADGGKGCFVFPRSHYPSYVLGDACIGLPWVGETLVCNLQACGAGMDDKADAIVKDLSLLYHVGEQTQQSNIDRADMFVHNINQLLGTIFTLEGAGEPEGQIYRKTVKAEAAAHKARLEAMLNIA